MVKPVVNLFQGVVNDRVRNPRQEHRPRAVELTSPQHLHQHDVRKPLGDKVEPEPGIDQLAFQQPCRPAQFALVGEIPGTQQHPLRQVARQRMGQGPF